MAGAAAGTPWSMIVGACVATVVVVGGVVVVRENSKGDGAPSPSPAPAVAPGAGGPVLGSSASRDGGGGVSAASIGEPEATQQCNRCKRTCDFFDASPICCNAQCGELCPNLMASYGCAPVVPSEEEVQPDSAECRRCKKACDYFGSSCCMDS